MFHKGENRGNCTGRKNRKKKLGQIVFYSDGSLAIDNQVRQTCLRKERCEEDDRWIQVVPTVDAACVFTRTAYQIILFPCQMKNWKLFSFIVKLSIKKLRREKTTGNKQTR